MDSVELLCLNGHPSHPRKVGEATYDAESTFLLSVRRTGKGSRRAQRSGSRLVDQGIPLQVFWRGSAAASIDALLEELNWECHKDLVGGSLPDSWLIGLYKCPEGHWVGTKDIGELLEWIDKAEELGVHSLPLPRVDEPDMEGFVVAEIPMEAAIGTNRVPV